MRLYWRTRMEENQNEENTQEEVKEETPVQENPGSGVSFPTVGAPRRGNGAKTLLIIGILILVGVLGFVIYKSAGSNEETPEPTPFENLTSPTEPTPSATTTASPKAADKSKVTIEVQNGTGIAGEAAYLQTQLKNLGYTSVTAGNATSQSETATTVTFAKSLASEFVDEITKKLKDLYQNVTVKTATTATKDVVVVTGLRKGVTAKPSATPAPTSTSTSSPTPTPTGTGN